MDQSVGKSGDAPFEPTSGEVWVGFESVCSPKILYCFSCQTLNNVFAIPYCKELKKEN